MGVTLEVGSPLRLWVLLAGEVVPAWLVEFLDDVVACVCVDLRGVSTVPAPSADTTTGRASTGRLDLLHRMDARLFGRKITLLQPVRLGPWADAHAVDLGAARDGTVAADVDLVLDLAGAEALASGVAPTGAVVWALRGVPVKTGDIEDELPGLAHLILKGERLVSFEIVARGPGAEYPRSICAGVCPMHPISPALTGEYLAASAHQLLVETLRAAARRAAPDGAKKLDDLDDARTPAGGSPGRVVSAAAAPPPGDGGGMMSLARFAARTATRRVTESVTEKQWFLLAGSQPPNRVLPDPAALRPILPDRGCYWADPFPLVRDGRTYVFFEEFVYDCRRGRISVVVLDGKGRPADKWVALELDSHLSYPCVFEHGGRLFMVPESAGTGTVDLYECVEMPASWEYRRTLLDGVRLVDASLVEWQGRWWMFAGLQKPAGRQTAELLMLYSAEDPIEGEWRVHPSSPLLADLTNARPAGAPFVLNDRLYRPAQDGSGGYGWGITLNEIVALDRNRYSERRIASLRPEWAWIIGGTHTLNRVGDLVVMDACRYMPRDPRRPTAERMMG